MIKLDRLDVHALREPRNRVGVVYKEGEGVYITLWAPKAQSVKIEWVEHGHFELTREGDCFIGFFDFARPGDAYWFYLDGNVRVADPASRWQQQDSNGPSTVYADNYQWLDADWQGVPNNEWLIYEIHVGAYSSSHDFSGVMKDLPRLKALGVTVVEIMPVAQFSGDRNWGYDGVFPHATQHSYGGPQAFKDLINAAHQVGIAVILDVVFNHLGPEDNMLNKCGIYESHHHQFAWGSGINFEDEHSPHVRAYFLQCVWQWIDEFHLDGLRLDAIHTIFDTSATHILKEMVVLAKAIGNERGFPAIMMGESDRNDPALLQSHESNGFGLDAHWADDFHHVIHAYLTGERKGYYADFGDFKQIVKVYRDAVIYDGILAPNRNRIVGRPYGDVDRKKLVACIQNHDQVGNRPFGERLINLIGEEKARFAAACLLLSPFTPLLFMGEEMGSAQPFLYFISHHDETLKEQIKNGRKEEWASFNWAEDPADPTLQSTFETSVLDFSLSKISTMQSYYCELIDLSKRVRTFPSPSVYANEASRQVTLTYQSEAEKLTVLLCFAERETSMPKGMVGELQFQSAPLMEMLPAFSAYLWCERIK